MDFMVSLPNVRHVDGTLSGRPSKTMTVPFMKTNWFPWTTYPINHLTSHLLSYPLSQIDELLTNGCQAPGS